MNPNRKADLLYLGPAVLNVIVGQMRGIDEGILLGHSPVASTKQVARKAKVLQLEVHDFCTQL